jgi:hypothetical protein
VKIGELIELLTAAAAELPEGPDSQVHVHICRGRDAFSIVTKEVTVDTSASVALVQGHPHRDDGQTVRRPVAMGVDDELARLVEDPDARHEEPPSSVMIQIDETKGCRCGRTGRSSPPAISMPCASAASATPRRTTSGTGSSGPATTSR